MCSEHLCQGPGKGPGRSSGAASWRMKKGSGMQKTTRNEPGECAPSHGGMRCFQGPGYAAGWVRLGVILKVQLLRHRWRLREQTGEWEIVKLGGNTWKGKDLYSLSSHNSLRWEEGQRGATDWRSNKGAYASASAVERERAEGRTSWHWWTHKVTIRETLAFPFHTLR